MVAEKTSGVLYIVATPIGNLEDITLRALRILREVGLIACEDTRRTSLLLRHFEISTPLLSCHKFNEKQRLERLLEQIQEGKSVALVSDAGTPSLSDPGALLVRACRSQGIPTIAAPGPSALLTAMACSSFAGEPFLFLGFLPSLSARRQKELRRLQDIRWNMVFYESPLRVLNCLEDMRRLLGERTVFLGRELTKYFEETLEGPLGQLSAQLQGRRLKGEITLIVAGAPEKETPLPPGATAVEKAMELIAALDISKKEAARRIAGQYGLSAKEIYRCLVDASS